MAHDAIIHVVDDDADFRASLVRLLTVLGYSVREYDGARAFIETTPPAEYGCALIDVCMPDMDGLTLQGELAARAIGLPLIFISGHGDVPMAVRAMKAGAVDFLQKPFTLASLRSSIEAALDRCRPAAPDPAPATATGEPDPEVAEFKARLHLLTAREREVLEGVVSGLSTKIIAFQLGISARTVDVHRAHIAEKLRIRGLPNLVRVALAAGVGRAPQ